MRNMDIIFPRFWHSFKLIFYSEMTEGNDEGGLREVEK